MAFRNDGREGRLRQLEAAFFTECNANNAEFRPDPLLADQHCRFVDHCGDYLNKRVGAA
jgi:hypothetical protein